MPDLVGAIVDFGTINFVFPNLHNFEAGDGQNPKHFGAESALLVSYYWTFGTY